MPYGTAGGDTLLHPTVLWGGEGGGEGRGGEKDEEGTKSGVGGGERRGVRDGGGEGRLKEGNRLTADTMDSKRR